MNGPSAMVAVTVKAGPETAFTLFTRDIGQWWGRGAAFEFHPGRAGTMRFEPGPDGRLVVDYGAGTVYEVGRVTAWEPGARLGFEWRLPTFRAGQSTDVEVSFRAVAGGTRITVEHGGWAAIPPDHPARHGLPPIAHGQQVGQFWQALLRRLAHLSM